MNEETMVFDEITTEEENTTVVVDEEESGGSAFVVIAFAAVTGIATAVGGWLLKKSGKIDEYRINKLEKKGYVVSKPEPVEENETDEVQADVLETE